jgi:orotate phosphoribosyltransferase
MLHLMDVLDLYKRTGAYLEGHFLLASGRHSPKFLQSTTVMQYPEHAEALGAALAEKFRGLALDFVLGPAMGGVILAHTVAKALGCRALFAEKAGKGMILRDAFKVTPGERFLAVEDVITTGGSLRKAIRAAEAEGATCVDIGCIIDRLGSPLAPRSLVQLEFPSYAPDACPLCQAGIPLEDV